MTLPPDDDLTPEDLLVAKLVNLSQQLPGGYQVALGIRLEQATAAAEELFTVHQLPKREELIAELTLWRCHAEDGLKFLDHTEHLLSAVMSTVKPNEPRR